jgi:hypothetical protein
MVGVPAAHQIAAQAPLWVRDRAWRMDAKEALGAAPNLNNSQRRAVAEVRVSLRRAARCFLDELARVLGALCAATKPRKA